ncbi:urease accessory protein UreF [Corallincola luteus]|uniref:Urease accessory protein UreF n=2 Tax=Corallincola TaxID=1775176 RepID=A0A368N6V8_9GAMM|nr:MULTISPECIES: urease accessory UreF family protein [Corallincola]RCU45274.1 urease accessory protein UreF [Corallincola holothuriorum]TCI02923.1 urease accessory protein UreF [Corallincola luteus]
MASANLLSLLHLSSPSLPIGAFAYSQGLESAVELGWVKDPDSLQQWLEQMMTHGLSHVDIPLLKRLYISWQQQDLNAVSYWQDVVMANRESAELLKEETQLGTTFSRLIHSLELAPEGGFAIPGERLPGYLSMYAYAAQKLQIPLADALAGWLWSWLENQVVVACKTVPLGQTAAQKILLKLHGAIQTCVSDGEAVADDEIGMTLPAFAMVSAWHEQQYSRLFRS